MNIDLWQIVTVILVVISSVAGLLKYVFYLLERHKDYMDTRFDEHKEHIIRHESQIKANHERVTELKEELYSDYVKSSRIDGEFSEMKKSFEQIFSFLTGLSRDVNQLIGKDVANENRRRSDNDQR